VISCELSPCVIVFLNNILSLRRYLIRKNSKILQHLHGLILNTTCRDIQTAIIKTCAYNNRSALKLAFGEEFDKLYPGSIYSPPSLQCKFFINGRLKSSMYFLRYFLLEDALILTVRSILGTRNSVIVFYGE
jgi:hypothetical protein